MISLSIFSPISMNVSLFIIRRYLLVQQIMWATPQDSLISFFSIFATNNSNFKKATWHAQTHKHTYLKTARWQFCKLKVKTEKEKEVNKMNSIAFGLKYLKKKKKQNNIWLPIFVGLNKESNRYSSEFLYTLVRLTLRDASMPADVTSNIQVAGL